MPHYVGSGLRFVSDFLDRVVGVHVIHARVDGDREGDRIALTGRRLRHFNEFGLAGTTRNNKEHQSKNEESGFHDYVESFFQHYVESVAR